MKTINIKITDKDLNFLLGFVKIFGLQETGLKKRSRTRLKKIYNKLNKEYMENEN